MLPKTTRRTESTQDTSYWPSEMTTNWTSWWLTPPLLTEVSYPTSTPTFTQLRKTPAKQFEQLNYHSLINQQNKIFFTILHIINRDSFLIILYIMKKVNSKYLDTKILVESGTQMLQMVSRKFEQMENLQFPVVPNV